MDLKSGYPYWAVKNGLMYAFLRLDADYFKAGIGLTVIFILLVVTVFYFFICKREKGSAAETYFCRKNCPSLSSSRLNPLFLLHK